MNVNKVFLAGNLTRDPQLSYTPTQTPVVDFGMAINRTWKGTDGQKREEVCFVDCRAFAKTGEAISQYLTKGKPIFIEGRLHFSSWEKDGVKHSKLRVTVDSFQFIGGKDDAQPARQPAPQQQQQQQAPQQQVTLPAFGSPEDDNSIPF